jgi:NifU-like protein involved in Fe-S cluster formation
MAYSDKVIDHYSNPRNVGTLDKSKKSVGTGLVGAPECGDVMRLQIEVDEATNTSPMPNLRPSAAARLSRRRR